MLFGIYVIVFNFVQIGIITRKNSCNNEMSRFCYIARSFSCGRHCVSFTLQLIWGNAIFVSVIAGVFTLSFVPRIVITKLQQLHNSLNVSNLTTLVLWKKYRLWEPWMTLLLLHLHISIVCFHYHLHFLRCLQRTQAQQQTFCTREKTNFSPNKKMHINVE